MDPAPSRRRRGRRGGPRSRRRCARLRRDTVRDGALGGRRRRVRSGTGSARTAPGRADRGHDRRGRRGTARVPGGRGRCARGARGTGSGRRWRLADPGSAALRRRWIRAGVGGAERNGPGAGRAHRSRWHRGVPPGTSRSAAHRAARVGGGPAVAECRRHARRPRRRWRAAAERARPRWRVPAVGRARGTRPGPVAETGARFSDQSRRPGRRRRWPPIRSPRAASAAS